MRILLKLVLLCGLTTSLFAANTDKKKTIFFMDQHKKTLKTFTLTELKASFKVHKIKTHNYVSHKIEIYKAFDLSKILDQVYGRNTWRNSYAIGTISTDKYAPIIKKNIYATLRPYLAFTRADGEKFISKKSYTKGPISLEPYYIIWKSPKSVGNLKKVRDHWPWKINKIFIFLKEPSELTASSPKFKPGQETFLNHCIACHSLNNLGGTKGADLAITTQKLSDEYLESYILNPRGTNPKSKMPQFPLYLDNKKARIKKLILYLRDKIKP